MRVEADVSQGAEPSQSIRSVERALDVLLLFTSAKSEMGITDIAQALDLSKSTVHRLLTALQNKGFVRQNPENQRYGLGLALLHLGQLVGDRLDLKQLARPIMNQLQEETEETVNLNIVQDGHRVCVEKVESRHDVRHFVDIGRSMPLYAGASGKVIMAYMDEHEVENVVAAGLRSYTGQTITDAAVLGKELQRIRERGYATSLGERVEGAASVSAPVWDYEGQVVASLTVSGPTFRFTPERVLLFVERLKAAAEQLSQELGYRTGGSGRGTQE